jgi:hypothetical protein
MLAGLQRLLKGNTGSDAMYDRLETWFFAQRVHEGVGLKVHEACIPQPQRSFKPFERLGYIAPLRVNRGVLVGGFIA